MIKSYYYITNSFYLLLNFSLVYLDIMNDLKCQVRNIKPKLYISQIEAGYLKQNKKKEKNLFHNQLLLFNSSYFFSLHFKQYQSLGKLLKSSIFTHSM